MSDYHIDVTEEEDKLFRDNLDEETNLTAGPKPNKTIVWSVVSLVHLAVASAVWIQCLPANGAPSACNEKDNIGDDKNYAVQKKFSEEVYKTVVNNQTDSFVKTSNIAKDPAPQKPQAKQSSPVYIIKQGDTLYSISKKHKVDMSKLIKINNITDPNKIIPGRTLKLM